MVYKESWDRKKKELKIISILKELWQVSRDKKSICEVMVQFTFLLKPMYFHR